MLQEKYTGDEVISGSFITKLNKNVDEGNGTISTGTTIPTIKPQLFIERGGVSSVNLPNNPLSDLTALANQARESAQQAITAYNNMVDKYGYATSAEIAEIIAS